MPKGYQGAGRTDIGKHPVKIDYPVTPSSKKAAHTQGSIPAGKLERMPNQGAESFKWWEGAPAIKGFLRAPREMLAMVERYLPVRPFGRRMVERAEVGGDNTMGQGRMPRTQWQRAERKAGTWNGPRGTDRVKT